MTEFWQGITGFVDDKLGISPGTFSGIVLTVIVLAVYFLLRTILVRLAARRIRDLSRKYIATKTITYLLGIFAVIALLRIWLGGAAGLATYLGLLSAGIAIALQDPLTNLAAWLYIISAKPFAIGDRIHINDRGGDVVDLGLFVFTINEIGNWVDADQSTGRVIRIPNNWVFKHACANYTQGFNFIWNELPVTVTFESNWQEARDILTHVAEQHSAVKSEYAANQIRKAAAKFLILYDKLSPIVWTSVAANGVTLTIRYLCEPRRRRSSTAKMWEEILREFAKRDDIDFAYPTQRFFSNVTEGKPEARAGGPPAGGKGPGIA